jgi:hypothetical protein
VIDLQAVRRFNEQHEKDCPARSVNIGEQMAWYFTQPVESNITFTLPGGCCALRSSYEMA